MLEFLNVDIRFVQKLGDYFATQNKFARNIFQPHIMYQEASASVKSQPFCWRMEGAGVDHKMCL